MVHRHPSAGSLGGNNCVLHDCCRLCFALLYMCSSVITIGQVGSGICNIAAL